VKVSRAEKNLFGEAVRKLVNEATDMLNADSSAIEDDGEREMDIDPDSRSGRKRSLTSREHTAVQHAYDVFNHELFEGKLPAVEFVLFYQPHWALDSSYGYFESQPGAKTFLGQSP
jgi:hypothetical protein